MFCKRLLAKTNKRRKNWLEKTPNRMYYGDFSNECEKKHEIIEKWDMRSKFDDGDDS